MHRIKVPCWDCDEEIDLMGVHVGLYVVVECDPHEYFHPDCFLDSEWYDESGMDRMVIDAHKKQELI